MLSDLQTYLEALNHPFAHTALSLLGLFLAAWLADLLVQRVLLRLTFKLLRSTTMKDVVNTGKLKFVPWLAHIVPAIMVSEGVTLIVGLPDSLAQFISNLAQAFVVLMLSMAASQLLNVLNDVYERSPNAHNKPIKGYLQIAKIILHIITVILIIALLVNRSPVILISSLGAAAAVLMFIFQDTLLSLVASVQISSGQLIRIGDWIEMPQLNADGFVIDIALHTVKVQNWDKTITSIPTKRFISDTFINWRGMEEAGGRRIKRSLLINQHSIRFLTEEDIEAFKEINLLQDYMVKKQEEINRWNDNLIAQGKPTTNFRRLTNLGTFRAYILQYLHNNPLIRKDMLLTVRQMAPTADGLPLEVYCFADTISFVPYEGIQSDLFDHLLSVITKFDLTVFQNPSGHDFRALARQNPQNASNG